MLLVEDNATNRDMLSRRLERKNAEVVFADDGQQRIDPATSELPDHILMDLSLPVVDGWGATRKIRGSTTSPAKRVRNGETGSGSFGLFRQEWRQETNLTPFSLSRNTPLTIPPVQSRH